MVHKTLHCSALCDLAMDHTRKTHPFALSCSATVGNLQSKVEGLTTTNALMKEDLAIARNSLLALQAENLALRRNAQQPAANNEHPNNVLDHIDPEMAEALSAERRKRHDAERELELQVNERCMRPVLKPDSFDLSQLLP